jgi:hypothetical protein
VGPESASDGYLTALENLAQFFQDYCKRSKAEGLQKQFGLNYSTRGEPRSPKSDQRITSLTPPAN